MHESIPGLVNALPNSVKVSTVWESKDHFLKDYVPYVELKVKGRLNTTHWKVIQAEKGMIVLDVKCGLCDCIDFAGKVDGQDQTKEHGAVTIAVTPILEAYEKSQITEWVEELQRHFDRAKARRGSLQT